MTAPHGAVGAALARYCAAVDAHDAETVARVLADAEVVFGDLRLTGRDMVAAHYARAFASGGPTRHMVTHLQVDTDAGGGTARYRAGYERWSLAAGTPRREARGSYTGTFTTAHGEWIWTEHRITTLVPSEEPDDDQ